MAEIRKKPFRPASILANIGRPSVGADGASRIMELNRQNPMSRPVLPRVGSTIMDTEAKNAPISGPVPKVTNTPAPPPGPPTAPISAPPATPENTFDASGRQVTLAGRQLPAIPAAPTATPEKPVVPPPAPTPAPAPVAPPTPPSAYDLAAADVERNMQLTPEEQALAQEQSDIRSSLAQGIYREGQRVSEMPLISGQQRALTQQALNLEAPLIDKMALLQARRTGALDASKFRLEQEQAKLDREQKAAEGTKPVVVGQGSRVVDPSTGRVIFEPPAEAPDTLDTQKKMLQIQKLQNDIAGSTDDIDRQIKQAQLQKLVNDIANPGAGKPPTAAQTTLATYATRIEQAEPTLKTLESKIANMNFLNFEAQLKLPSAFQSAEMQQYMQAARNYINAVLRRESGAVISPSEFAEARQQYLPQPGDRPEVLKMKEDNRMANFKNFVGGAGNAYQSLDQLLGGGTATGGGQTDGGGTDWDF